MKDLKVGSKVKVKINDKVQDDDFKYDGSIAEIISKDDWIFPFELRFEDENLNKLNKDCPRRFSNYELELV